MKKTILLFFVNLTLLTCNAQKMFPVPSDNPYWIEGHGQFWGSCFCYSCGGSYMCSCKNPVYYLDDIEVNGITYNCLYSHGVCLAEYIGEPPYCGNCPYTEPEVLFAMIRQDTINQKVYIYMKMVMNIYFMISVIW